MKIRLFGDSVRIRLTQTEVEALARGGAVECVLPFPGQALACVVQSAADSPLEARHAAGRITVRVPHDETNRWAASTEEGMYATSGALRVAVEKDYRCIHKPDSPENAGAFPNPLGAEKNIG